MAPSFYELLQAVSKLSFKPPERRNEVAEPSPPPSRLIPPHLHVAARFTRSVAHDEAPQGKASRVASICTLASGSTLAPGDAALLREISDLLRTGWAQGHRGSGFADDAVRLKPSRDPCRFHRTPRKLLGLFLVEQGFADRLAMLCRPQATKATFPVSQRLFPACHPGFLCVGHRDNREGESAKGDVRLASEVLVRKLPRAVNDSCAPRSQQPVLATEATQPGRASRCSYCRRAGWAPKVIARRRRAAGLVPMLIEAGAATRRKEAGGFTLPALAGRTRKVDPASPRYCPPLLIMLAAARREGAWATDGLLACSKPLDRLPGVGRRRRGRWEQGGSVTAHLARWPQRRAACLSARQHPAKVSSRRDAD